MFTEHWLCAGHCAKCVDALSCLILPTHLRQVRPRCAVWMTPPTVVQHGNPGDRHCSLFFRWENGGNEWFSLLPPTHTIGAQYWQDSTKLPWRSLGSYYSALCFLLCGTKQGFTAVGQTVSVTMTSSLSQQVSLPTLPVCTSLPTQIPCILFKKGF